jgi:hypothetical protein
MSAVTFDTLKFVQRLEKAGVAREHAMAEAEALAEAFASNTSALATKGDIERLESKIEAIELRLTIKLGAFMAASVGTTVALVKLL